MSRLKLVAILVIVASGLVLVPATGAADAPFLGKFKGKQTRNDPPCAGAVFCGSGAVDGYGDATYAVVPTSLGPLAGNCRPVTGVISIALSDGSGTLTLDATGEVCYPGKAINAPGQLKSFGNPFAIETTYTVIGGTGVFAGASGSGSAVLRGAGASTHATISGVLST